MIDHFRKGMIDEVKDIDGAVRGLVKLRELKAAIKSKNKEIKELQNERNHLRAKLEKFWSNRLGDRK